MDLRDRDNLDLLVPRLLAAGVSEAAAFAALKREDSELNGLLFAECNKREEQRVQKSSLRSWSIVPLRLHAFYTLNNDEFTLRLCSLEEHAMSDFVSQVDFTIGSNEHIVWKRTTNKEEGICITRNNVSANIFLVEIDITLDYPNLLLPVPPSFGSPLVYADFINLFKLICNYIGTHNLSSNDDPSYFTPDDVLHQILYPNLPRNHPVSFASLIDVVRAQVKPPGPFRISLPIDPKQMDPAKTEHVFELMVQVQSVPFEEEAVPNLLEFRQQTEVDQAIAGSSANIEAVTNECRFLEQMAQNPVGFLQTILQNPTGTSTIDSTGKIDFAQLSTSYDFYKQPWAVAAAAYVVNEQRKSAEKRYI